MTIEERLRASAQRVAGEVEPPVLDIDLIRRRAQVGRRRRSGILAAALVIVAVAVLVPRLVGSSPPPAEPADRPPGSVQSGAVWSDADGLHLGHRVIGLPFDTQESRCQGDPACLPFTSLALVAGGVVYGDHRSQRVWYQPWTGPARVIGEGSMVGPAGDPDGSTAAWFDGTELVMFDTATDRELVRADQPEEHLPSPQRENAHGNRILDVASDGVSWQGQFLHRFDRATSHTSRRPMDVGHIQADVHAGRVAMARDPDRGITSVESPVEGTSLRLERGQLTGPVRFNADGRYLAGYTVGTSGETVTAYHTVVADTQTGEVFIPSREKFYPWNGWGYGDTLMVIQDFDNGTHPWPADDGTDRDGDRLLACDVSDRSCQRLPYNGVITLPNN